MAAQIVRWWPAGPPLPTIPARNADDQPDSALNGIFPHLIPRIPLPFDDLSSPNPYH